MKILTANIALGLPNMDRFFPAMRGHLAFHGRTMVRFLLYPRGLKRSQAYTSEKRTAFLAHHIDLRNTLALIEEAQADIVVLNEVLPQFHKKILSTYFARLGYGSVVWGESTHYPDATVSTLIASKIPGVSADIDLSWESHAGGGAGIAVLRLNTGVTVVGLHLGIADKFPWLYKAEMEALAKFVAGERGEGRGTILVGDWNASATAIQRFTSFAKLDLVAADQDTPTCPTFLPWLKPLDHIFIPREWSSETIRTIPFGSDHLALSAEVTAPDR